MLAEKEVSPTRTLRSARVTVIQASSSVRLVSQESGHPACQLPPPLGPQIIHEPSDGDDEGDEPDQGVRRGRAGSGERGRVDVHRVHGIGVEEVPDGFLDRLR